MLNFIYRINFLEKEFSFLLFYARACVLFGKECLSLPLQNFFASRAFRQERTAAFHCIFQFCTLSVSDENKKRYKW